MDWSGRLPGGAEIAFYGLVPEDDRLFSGVRGCSPRELGARRRVGALSGRYASSWARVTPDRRAGRGDGSPAAQVCRLTASEPLPGGGTRACFRSRRSRVPVGDELAVGAFGLFAQGTLSCLHLLQGVGTGAATAAV
jgi:hypothetical protein